MAHHQIVIVGGGMFSPEDSGRDEADLIPYGVKWIKDRVETFAPTDNQISTLGGESIAHDYLVVAPGIQINWD
ncbi:hypothetical protein [Rhodopirellula bahusiensis]|uniref:hypothetical protein n=1 Tax=Rhodopirellula bahusiensis TaxID=2014065 RepID=UPI003267AC9F